MIIAVRCTSCGKRVASVEGARPKAPSMRCMACADADPGRLITGVRKTPALEALRREALEGRLTLASAVRLRMELEKERTSLHLAPPRGTLGP